MSWCDPSAQSPVRSSPPSHEEAIEKAKAEYEKYRALHSDEISPVERHFIEAVTEVKQLEKTADHRKTRNRKQKE
jgi:hypothetical protein